ncbi:MAG: type III toxin-antitoxin system ToxN/AbiQ family toxin [Clostridia bacterium]|nr:type III toxin-antitoxin system ToxN/AbiQ family toxin [Clostridia bacterium]
MDNIKLYEINPRYITYLSAYSPHLFLNKQAGQKNERKYIGIVFRINQYDYFAPLSSFKNKHKFMNESLDFIKIGNYAVINLNNMFPVPPGERFYVDIGSQRDPYYRDLLLAEYRIIKSIQEKIRKTAQNVYKIKLRDGDSTSLAKRCNDFLLLEKAYNEFIR